MRGSTAYNAVQLIRHGYTYSIAVTCGELVG